jgi:hypothetical protein
MSARSRGCPSRAAIIGPLVLPFIITVTHSGGEAPALQGARRENTWGIQPTSNAAGRDASAAECHRNYESQHLVRQVPDVLQEGSDHVGSVNGVVSVGSREPLWR